MKILFLLSNFFKQRSGGAEYQAYLLARHLSHQHTVTYVFIDEDSRWTATECEGIKLYPIPRRPLTKRILGDPYFLDYLRLTKIFNKLNPDIIYQRVGLAHTGIAAYYAKKTGCRMVWHIAHESDLTSKPMKTYIRSPFKLIDVQCLNYGIRHATHIIGQAEYQNSLLKKQFGRECDLVVPNFHPNPENHPQKRRIVQVVWVANLKPWKRPELFIMLARAFLNHPDVQFLLVGRSGVRKRWSALKSEMETLSNVHYLGEKPIEEVNRILAESHIFVNTSKHEGFPNTFIQAWMRKVPVVSLNVDPDDVLVRKGIGFHSKTFEQMVEDVRRLVNDASLRNEMGQKAYAYAMKHHTLDENVRKIEHLFEHSIQRT